MMTLAELRAYIEEHDPETITVKLYAGEELVGTAHSGRGGSILQAFAEFEKTTETLVTYDLDVTPLRDRELGKE